MSAQPQSDDGNLPAARNELGNAISALIDPKPHTVHRDDGTTPITWIDSLYDQLSDAIAGQSGERSGRHTTSPIWADVVDLMTKIHTAAAEWHPEWPLIDVSGPNPQPATILRLQAIQARKWRPQDVPAIGQITKRLEGFAEDIRRLLSGERILFLYAAQGRDLAPCPQCGESIIRRPDNSGQIVRQPALQIKSDGTTHCVNKQCRATWPNPQFLARLLGYETPAGLLE
jgi:hypothetical protein